MVDEIGGIEEAIKYAANMNELKNYQVEYYGDELTYGEKIIKKLQNNSEISQREPSVLSALDGLVGLLETFISIKEPKALFTCMDCLVELD